MSFVPRKTTLALIFPVLLTACAGKGSFDSTVVKNDNPSALSQGNNSTKPNDKPSENTSSENTAPENTPSTEAERVKGLGFGVDVPRRNQANYDKEGNALPPKNSLEKIGSVEYRAKISGNPKSLNEEDFNNFKKNTNFNFENIRLGVERYSEYVKETEGPDGKEYVLYDAPKERVYYRAENTAKALPVDRKITYKGIWHFTTDASLFDREEKKLRDRTSLGLIHNDPGKNFGATSEDVKQPGGHSSEFIVDFETKKLTGKLSKIARLAPNEVTERYSIEAELKDNRFYGKAKALDKSSTGLEYFHADSDNVEGGFYGLHANELAGSFLANDNSAFVVFGAKSEDTQENPILVDAFKINVEDNEDVVRANLNTYFDLSKLVIDGQEIPLANKETILPSGDKITISVCCSNLNVVKFGMFNHESKRHIPAVEEDESIYEEDDIFDEEVAESEVSEEELDSENNVQVNPNLKDPETLNYTNFGKHLFIQGKRTPTDDIPKEKTFIYEGNWQGYSSINKYVPSNISTNSETEDIVDEPSPKHKIQHVISISPDSGKAKFTANFADKILKGELTRLNKTQQVINIEANIKENGFSGKAKTGDFGIILDEGNTLGVHRVKFDQAIVEGAFYGKNAEEIGGSIYSQEPKFGAVFGGKKVENKEK